MKSNLINLGDSVVFAQHYLPTEPSAEFYDKKGVVLDLNGKNATVRFKGSSSPVVVLVDDLEPIYNEPIVSTNSQDTIQLLEDHECSGLNKASLISEKLLAQEYDPTLDKEISALINLSGN